MTAALTNVQVDQLARWNAWKDGPRPRPVRLKRSYRFWCGLLAAVCVIVPSLLLGSLMFEWRASPAKHVMNSDLLAALPFMVLPPIFLLIVFWISAGHRRLVAQGEISIGRVTDVRLRRRGPEIAYEFLDGSGRLITGSSPDDTRSFLKGMDVPIFYDPKSPETGLVALCGSAFEVADVQ